MKIGIVVSARTASTRLPGKALLKIKGIPAIIFLMTRLARTIPIANIVLATTDLRSDDALALMVEECGFQVFRGACQDLVKRHIDLNNLYKFDYIVRVTGDCPLVDGEVIMHCINQVSFCDEFVFATTKGSFPPGIDCEIFDPLLLKSQWTEMTVDEKEHLTLKFYSPEFNGRTIKLSRPSQWVNTSKSYLLDTPEDYIKFLCLAKLMDDVHMSVADILQI
jgi:spore coat polysaccharide biosynthesis protein SpsF